MASPKSRLPLNDQAREAAADWLIAFSEGEVDASGRDRFLTWLRSSPEHVRAYLRVSALWEDDDLLSQSRKLDADALVQRVAERKQCRRLRGYRRWNPKPARRTARARMGLAIAASMLLAVGGGLFAWLQLQGRATYETAVGEQRTVTLADGSTIALNARSRVIVKYGKVQRGVELLEGQALFRVAKDAARPFVVRSGATSIRAVGTQFDVYRKTGRTVVTVLEGRVAVSGVTEPREVGPTPPAPELRDSSVVAAGSDASAFVSAGEQLVATPNGLTPMKQADIAAATAWQDGKLIFNAEPLSDVLDEFNRHTPRRLVLEDAALGAVEISGIFCVRRFSSIRGVPAATIRARGARDRR